MKTITKACTAAVAGTALVGAVLALGSGSATAESSTWVGGDVPAPNARVGVQNNVLAPGLRTTRARSATGRT